MWLEVTSGPDAGAAVELPADRTFVLGRQRGCDLVVRDARASRQHAELVPAGEERWTLRDLDSANGTFVDGVRVEETVALEGGEDIRIGDVVFSVRRGAPAPSAEPVPAVTNRTPAGDTAMAPRVATQSMVMRLVEAGTRRASRTGLLAGAGALVAAVAVIAVLLATGVIGGGEDDRVPEVVAEVAPSVVLISARQGEVVSGTGSGWVLDAGEGLIVTNAHVVNQGTRFTVAADGRSRPAELVGAAPCEDIALLRVQDAEGLETARLASSDSVSQGETVVALGFPADAAAGDAVAATRGVVSRVETEFTEPGPDVPIYTSVLQTDTPLNPGNSGGPLVDLDARVVGVDAAARTTGDDGRALQKVNYAITIDRARSVIADLRAGQAAAWAGVTFAYPQPKPGEVEGLVVSGVHPGTPAAEAGIETGALIVGVNNNRLEGPTLSDYCKAIGGGVTGDEVILNLDQPGTDSTRVVRTRLA